MNLHNKTAILTGASSGLGAAIVRALTDKGVEVYGLARNKEKLEILKNELGERFHPVVMDITDGKKLTQWVNENFSEENIPDILVNNAGVGSFHKIDEMSSDTWHNMVDVNLNGMYYITSAVSAWMKKTDKSSYILNIGSILGTMGRPEGAAYCATKYGISGFSDALFRELRSFNIKVTCLNPGSIETSFFETSGIKSHGNMLHSEELADLVVYVLGTPDNMLINELTVRPLDARAPRG